MNKVARYQITKPMNMEWNQFGDILRQAQRETRHIMNRTIQLCWEWANFCSEYKAKHAEYPKPVDIIGFKTIEGHCYNVLGKNPEYIQNSANISQAINMACRKWKTDAKDIFKGDKSIASYKKDNPIIVHKNSIKLYKVEQNYYLTLSLVNLGFKGKHSLTGIVNLFTVIDEFSPQWELFRAISTKNRVKLPEKEDLFPTLRGK